MRISTFLVALTFLALLALATTAHADDRTDASDASDAPQASRIEVGQEAPDFALRDSAGQTHTLSDFRGTKDVVVIFFRGHW